MRSPRAMRFWPLLLIVLLVDCTTKRFAEERLSMGLPHEVAGEVVQLTLTYNTGAAFGIPLGPVTRVLLIALALGAVGLLLWLYFRRTAPHDSWRAVALALLCAGAVGNLVDRLRHTRGVVDFIDIGLGSVRFWTFNVADVAVTVGALMLALSLWKEEDVTIAQPVRQ